MEITLQEISNLFSATDQDKNGTLSRDEICAIMTQIKNGIVPSNDELTSCFSIMDKNGDGVINEAEFTEAMVHWLGLTPSAPNQGNKKRSLEMSPDAVGRRKQAVLDMAGFFKHFSPVTDFNNQQNLILSRQRPPSIISVTHILREYPTLSNNEKADIHKKIMSIINEGRVAIANELYSLDWNTVVIGATKVHDLLAIMEVFHSADER
jgi:hypothetical protein